MAATHNQDKLDLPKLIEHELFDSVTLAAKYFVSILDEHRSGEVCREGPGPQESVREVEREGAGAGGKGRERDHPL